MEMGLADGTYEILEEKVASLLDKEGEALKFCWVRKNKSGGLLQKLTHLVRSEGPDLDGLTTIDLAFI